MEHRVKLHSSILNPKPLNPKPLNPKPDQESESLERLRAEAFGQGLEVHFAMLISQKGISFQGLLREIHKGV